MIKAISVLVAAVSVIAYLGPHVSPEIFWPAGFLSLAIPVLLLFNFLLFCYFLVRMKLFLLLPLCVLILGYEYLDSSFSFSPMRTEKPRDKSFSVLSYNVRVFNTYAYLHNENEPGKTMINWLAENHADINCLQEFYNDDTSPVFNVVEKMTEQQELHAVVVPTLVNRIGAQFGLAIFSRLPIIHSGEIVIEERKPYQHAIFADIVTPHDTIRVYNIHLQSMHIDEEKIDDLDRASENYLDIAHKLRFGFMERARQVDNLLLHIQQSPHPVLVCGDLNDMPYSYSYFALKEQLANAFEEAGCGMGFSYNGKLFFLRIDNQFYSPELKAIDFHTLRDVRFSDHFPIRSVYNWQK